ncbi:MAG: UDP-N-acetylmuramate--L-alanine ligase [Syntrophomonadaceae bacterium]
MTTKSKQWIHMVGIAGAGMSNIATVLVEQGHRVSGSDLQSNNITMKLQEIGIEVYQGHSSSNLKEGVDLLVSSSAIPQDNIEVKRAREKNIPVLKRGQMLANIVNDSKAIAVAGAHGKTTTTSMLYTVLDNCGLDPTFILGGEMQDNGRGAKLGQGEFSIIEADESDGSFLDLSPYIAVVTNIEDDHLDYYKSLENIQKAFKLFVDEVKPDGFALLYNGDASVAKIKAATSSKIITYGEKADCDYYMQDWQVAGKGSKFSVFFKGLYLGEVILSVPGKHNSLNALATMATVHEIGLDFETAARVLGGFKGAKRRFEHVGQFRDINIVDDYAHHPTEIKATLEAARNYHPEGRIIAVFQPHRFSRTKMLGTQLGTAFIGVDKVIITDIYPAGEKPVPGVSGRMVYEAAINAGCDAEYLSSFPVIEKFILNCLKDNDLLITMGAGDIWKLGISVLEKLQKNEAQA